MSIGRRTRYMGRDICIWIPSIVHTRPSLVYTLHCYLSIRNEAVEWNLKNDICMNKDRMTMGRGYERGAFQSIISLIIQSMSKIWF